MTDSLSISEQHPISSSLSISTTLDSSVSQSIAGSQKSELMPIEVKAPTDEDKVLDSDLILKKMVDPKSGFTGLMCSDDNGVTWTYEYGPSGKKFHKRDIERISNIPFDKILMRSSNGAVFSLTVNDDGELKTEKVGDN